MEQPIHEIAEQLERKRLNALRLNLSGFFMAGATWILNNYLFHSDHFMIWVILGLGAFIWALSLVLLFRVKLQVNRSQELKQLFHDELSALNQLKTYRWPGNVRELKNVVERAVVLARTDVIEIDELNLSNLSTASESQIDVSPSAYQPISLAEMERHHILNTLKATGWNKSRTAKILGIERSTLDRKIRRYEITRRNSAEI